MSTKTKKRTGSARTKGPRHSADRGQAVFEPVGQSAMMPSGMGPSAHLRALEPLPAHIDDPEGYTDELLKKLMPLAAKEKEWQMKFGSDTARDRVASEILAIHGRGAKKEAGINVPAVINLVAFANPWAKPTALPPDQRTSGLGLPASAQTVDAKSADAPVSGSAHERTGGSGEDSQ